MILVILFAASFLSFCLSAGGRGSVGKVQLVPLGLALWILAEFLAVFISGPNIPTTGA